MSDDTNVPLSNRCLNTLIGFRDKLSIAVKTDPVNPQTIQGIIDEIDESLKILVAQLKESAGFTRSLFDFLTNLQRMAEESLDESSQSMSDADDDNSDADFE